MKYLLAFENKKIKEGNFEIFFEVPGSLSSKKDLINLFRNELNFPDKTGSNWDAFYDILSDLYWLDIKEVVVYHDSLPQLNENDLIIYLETIRDLLKNSDKMGKILKFVFNDRDKEKVQSLMQTDS